ncbi:MAG: hypothetical protein ACPKQO_01850 [Nitrososphaeraceae archaeon]
MFEPVYDYNANILVYNFNLNNTLDKLSSEFEQSTLIIDNRCGLICDSAS